MPEPSFLTSVLCGSLCCLLAAAALVGGVVALLRRKNAADPEAAEKQGEQAAASLSVGDDAVPSGDPSNRDPDSTPDPEMVPTLQSDAQPAPVKARRSPTLHRSMAQHPAVTAGLKARARSPGPWRCLPTSAQAAGRQRRPRRLTPPPPSPDEPPQRPLRSSNPPSSPQEHDPLDYEQPEVATELTIPRTASPPPPRPRPPPPPGPAPDFDAPRTTAPATRHEEPGAAHSGRRRSGRHDHRDAGSSPPGAGRRGRLALRSQPPMERVVR